VSLRARLYRRMAGSRPGVTRRPAVHAAPRLGRDAGEAVATRAISYIPWRRWAAAGSRTRIR
jgi:hypothetical protein